MSTDHPLRVSPRDDLTGLEAYHSPQLDVRVRLNTNESPYPPPAEFVESWLASVADAPLHRYPDRAARELRAALATRIGQPVERVFCANGSNEVLQTILLTFGGPGRRVAVFEPTYALHSHIARITSTDVVVGERTRDFAIDLRVATRLAEEHGPELLFACTPNNPTGTVEPRETLTALGRAAPGLVVVDEAYAEFASWSAIELVDDDQPFVVVRTYSKVWSLAALRLGFCVAPEPVVAELEKVVLPYHLSVPTQRAGIEALRYGSQMEDRVARLVAERKRLSAELERRPGVTTTPSGANFVLMRPAARDGTGARGRALWEALVARGVLVRDFSRWPRLEDCLRVTVGTQEENDEFLRALDGALEELPDRNPDRNQ